MNSSIVSEQKNGRTPADIMAGLCRSIIANVFTKVVRVPNLDSLGEHIVVQGGTFRNDAVLCALEQHIGRPVTRAPTPGSWEPSASRCLRATIWQNKHANRQNAQKAKPGPAHPLPPASQARPPRPALSSALMRSTRSPTSSVRTSPARSAPTAATAPSSPSRTAPPSSRATVARVARSSATRRPRHAFGAQNRRRAGESRPENLFEARQKLLFQDWPIEQVAPDRGVTIGIPRVLAFWDTMPFWNALLRSLGFAIRLSRPSTRAMFEEGLPQVASDTICFPRSWCTAISTNSHAPASDRIIHAHHHHRAQREPPHQPAYPCAPW